MGVLVAVAGLVLWGVVTDTGVATLDQPVLDWVLAHRSPWLTTVAKLASTVGGTVGSTALAVGLSWWAWLRGRRFDAVAALVAAAGAVVLFSTIKVAVGRARPPPAVRLTVENAPSFPSGHSLCAAAAAVVAVSLVGRLVGRRWVRVAVAVLASTLAALIGVSRVYLGVHWATDVLAGWLLGAGWALACLGVADAASRRGRPG